MEITYCTIGRAAAGMGGELRLDASNIHSPRLLLHNQRIIEIREEGSEKAKRKAGGVAGDPITEQFK